MDTHFCLGSCTYLCGFILLSLFGILKDALLSLSITCFVLGVQRWSGDMRIGWLLSQLTQVHVPENDIGLFRRLAILNQILRK